MKFLVIKSPILILSSVFWLWVTFDGIVGAVKGGCGGGGSGGGGRRRKEWLDAFSDADP